MLKLRLIGIDDYSVVEDKQRIGRIRLASERTPPIWLWTVNSHLTGGLPMGSSHDLDTAKAEFKAAWEGPEGKALAGGSCCSLQGDEHSWVMSDGGCRSLFGLSRIAQLDQRTALPDQCLHSAEADVRPPGREVRV